MKTFRVIGRGYPTPLPQKSPPPTPHPRAQAPSKSTGWIGLKQTLTLSEQYLLNHK